MPQSPLNDLTRPSRRTFLKQGSMAAAPVLDPRVTALVEQAASVTGAAQNFYGLTALMEPQRLMVDYQNSFFEHLRRMYRNVGALENEAGKDAALLDALQKTRPYFDAMERHHQKYRTVVSQLSTTDAYWDKLTPQKKDWLDQFAAEHRTEIEGAKPAQLKRLGAFLLEWRQHGDIHPGNGIIDRPGRTAEEYAEDPFELRDGIHRLFQQLTVSPNGYAMHARNVIKECASEGHIIGRSAYQQLGLQRECGDYDKAINGIRHEIATETAERQSYAKQELQAVLHDRSLHIEHRPRHRNSPISDGLTESYHLMPADENVDAAFGIRMLREKLATYLNCEQQDAQSLRRHGILCSPSQIDVIDPSHGTHTRALKHLLDEAVKMRHGAKAVPTPGG